MKPYRLKELATQLKAVGYWLTEAPKMCINERAKLGEEILGLAAELLAEKRAIEKEGADNGAA